MQLGFNLSNGVTDTLESSSILIYSKLHVRVYTQRILWDATLIKEWLDGDYTDLFKIAHEFLYKEDSMGCHID